MNFPTAARKYFGLKEKDARDWTLKTAKADGTTATDSDYSTIYYRPFDSRWTCYTGNSRGLYASPQSAILGHIRRRRNVALVINKTLEGERPFADALLFSDIVQHHSLSLKEVNYVAPLYIYPDEEDLDQSIRLNFNSKLYKQFLTAAGLAAEQSEITDPSSRLSAKGNERPAEIKVLDYIYAILHWPGYRRDYAEFLSISFPRIPLPASSNQFNVLSAKGEALRRLHLMERSAIGEAPYPFHGEGRSVVDKPRFGAGRVWINVSQYFENVPAVAWDFPIGSYQPAQKWLNDRKGRALTWDDIRHYQKIIKILAETARIMREIELAVA